MNKRWEQTFIFPRFSGDKDVIVVHSNRIRFLVSCYHKRVIHKGCPHKLGNFWDPRSLCAGLPTFGWPPPLPPSPCPWGHKAGIIWNITTCEQFTLKGKKKLIILILDVHTCVFLLDNFDNSIPKEGADHKVNVTDRHDWPNKNASVPKSLSGKRIEFCCRYSCLKIM